MTKMKNTLIIFENSEIRRVWFNEEWYYSVIDVVKILTNSLDAKDYWYRVKTRELKHGVELSTICRRLKLRASDDKLRLTDCANRKSLFRILQSIPSKNAEPFKLWLAKIGDERIEEIENPELGQDRIKEYYELKGYPKEGGQVAGNARKDAEKKIGNSVISKNNFLPKNKTL